MSYGGSSLIATLRLHRPRRQRLACAASPESEPRRLLDARSGSMASQTCRTSGRGSNRSWPGSRSPLATSGWSGAASGRSTGPPASPGCSSIPTPTRSGCPTRGSRSSTRSSTNATTPSAERAYAPWLDLDGRAAGRTRCPLFSVDTHRAAGDFDVFAFNLSAELVYTNVLECLDLAGVPVRAEDRAARAPDRDRRRPLRVQPRADGRLRRRVRDRRRRGAGRRDHRGASAAWKRAGRAGGREARAARARHDPGRLRAVDVRRRVRRAAFIAAVAPRYPDVPERGRQAHGRRPRASGRTRRSSSCRSSRWCTTGSTSRSSAAARAAAASARRG